MELLLPPGATATVDERDVVDQRKITFDQFSSNQIQQVKVAVRFSDGTEEQRLVDLEPGRHVRVPVNRPPVDKPVAVVTESPSPMLWAAFSPDGRSLATASEDRSVVVWDFALGRPTRSFSGHLDAVQSVAFSPDSQWLLTASIDGTAVVWDVRTGQIIRTLKHSAGVNSAVFSRDGKSILTGSSDKTAVLWDAATGAPIRAFKAHSGEVVAVAISSDGLRVATGATDRSCLLWDAGTGQQLFSLRHSDTVSGVVFSSDGARLATACFDNTTILWETASGRRVSSTRRVELDLNGIALSPDDRRTFTAGKDATAKMWDTESRKMLREFTGHSFDVSSVTVSPDGHLLLTASRDGTARLWEIATGSELASFASGDGGKIWAVVTPDGLFDASEPGRQKMGFRFAGRLPGAVIDQFFGELYRPGLLVEILRGERPMAPTQLGRSLPPKVKIVSPKARSSTNQAVEIVMVATDQGGGVSGLRVYHNGARINTDARITRNGETTQGSFNLMLAQGANKIRVIADSSDGSWEAIPAEIDLGYAGRPDRKSRLFVVAVGIADYSRADLPMGHPDKDAQALADLLQRRSAKFYDRVDVIPLLGRDATRALIQETLADVAALTKPHDTLVLLLCGRGAMLGDRLYFAPQDLRLGAASREAELRAQGLAVDDLVSLLGSAGALRRVLILDAADTALAGAQTSRLEFGLRGAVERWSRSQGIYVIASVASLRDRERKWTGRGPLGAALLGAAGDESGASTSEKGLDLGEPGSVLDLVEWFSAAARRAEPLMDRTGPERLEVQHSTQVKSFPFLVVGR